MLMLRADRGQEPNPGMRLVHAEAKCCNTTPQSERVLQIGVKGDPSYHKFLSADKQQKARPETSNNAFRAQLMAQAPLSMYYQGPNFSTAFQKHKEDESKLGQQTDELADNTVMARTNQAVITRPQRNEDYLNLSPLMQQQQLHNGPGLQYFKELKQSDAFTGVIPPPKSSVNTDRRLHQNSEEGFQARDLHSFQNQSHQIERSARLGHTKSKEKRWGKDFGIDTTSEEMGFAGLANLPMPTMASNCQAEENYNKCLRNIGSECLESLACPLPSSAQSIKEKGISDNESENQNVDVQDKVFIMKEINQGLHIGSRFSVCCLSNPNEQSGAKARVFSQKNAESSRMHCNGRVNTQFMSGKRSMPQTADAESQRAKENVSLRHFYDKVPNFEIHDRAPRPVTLPQQNQEKIQDKNTTKFDPHVQSFDDNDWNNEDVLIPQTRSGKKASFQLKPKFTYKSQGTYLNRNGCHYRKAEQNSKSKFQCHERAHLQTHKVSPLQLLCRDMVIKV